MRKRHKKHKVLNALDFPNVEIASPDEEEGALFQMPEDVQDLLNDISEKDAIGPSEPLAEIPKVVDLWKEIKRHLTMSEFQIFELKYKFQHRQTDIVKITGHNLAHVNRVLKKAITKLRKAFSGESNSKRRNSV